MAISANAFAKCAPAFSTNIRQCGTVTACQAVPMTVDLYTETYMQSGDYKIMGALDGYDFQIKVCSKKEGTLYEFLMANKVNLSKKLDIRKGGSMDRFDILPYVLMKQPSILNNSYWNVTNGVVSGSNWRVDVHSTNDTPMDTRWFNVGDNVFINGQTAGGTSTQTAWTIVSTTPVDSDTVRLVLSSQNLNSALSAARLANPTRGLLTRGVPNVNRYEKYCAEGPVVLDRRKVPSWIQATRHSMCKDEYFTKFNQLLLSGDLGNSAYREYEEVDSMEKNRQLSRDWQKRWTETFFKQKPRPNQTLNGIDSLEEIDTFPGAAGYAFDIGGGRCIGRRANATGVYEQIAECGGVYDAQGAKLNLPALFESLYELMRIREAAGHPNPTSFDIFTDSRYAEIINQGMIGYYKDKGQDMLRLNVDVSSAATPKPAPFGFNYRSYPLFWPQVTLNVLTHYFFDDYQAASIAAGNTTAGRVVWILDFAGIYPGIISSSTVVNKTGDLKALAAIDASFACVMDVMSTEQTLMELVWTTVVECPAGNVILENLSDAVPEFLSAGSTVYPPNLTSTTSSTTS